MKVRWGKRKWTLVIIPEAERSVIRLGIRFWAIACAAGLLSALLVSAALMSVLQVRTSDANGRLKTELMGQTAHYDQTLADKNQSIEQLEQQVIELSRQAKDVEQRMEQMKKLEDDLRSLTGGGGDRSATVLTSSGPAQSSAIGGDFIPITEEQINKLSDETKAAFTELTGQIDALQKSMSTAKEEALEQKRKLAATPTIWPADIHTVTSGYSYRIDPFTRQPSFHSGIDIGAHMGDPVYATADGTVIATGSDDSRGINILIGHADGLRTWYMHLSKILVKQKDRVEQGQKIGLVGATGRATGPHLHYEVLKNGVTVDPMPYLKQAGKGN